MKIKKESLNGIELGLNYTPNKISSLFVNYSHSYQSSSLDRLFSFSTGIFTGYVEPSQANNYTLGYNNIQKSNKFKIAVYYIDLKNEIYYYPGINWTGARNTNIDKSHKYGVDLYDKYIFNSDFNVAFNYNYVQAIIDDEIENGENYAGNKLPGVSDHNVKATINYLPNEYATISLTQVYRSESYAANDFNNNFSQKQDAYYSTDIAATYAKDNWEIFAKINNLFDQSNGLWIKDDSIYPINFTRTALAGFKLKY
ncbi:MAG: TonB-dependent receptor [Sulfurimonas sp.]|nr:TonB-dependent receptor [Sulfurimonas sp.]